MITWGVVCNSHDASIAVFKTGQKGLSQLQATNLVWAGLAKDFSGIPNDPDLNDAIVEHALQYGKPNKVIWYERPFLKTLRQYWAGQGWLGKENDIRTYLKRWDITCKIEYTQHHLSHAAYAYYTQPHDDCAVICLDSIGEFETLTIWHGKNNKLKKIHSQGYPHSLGLFYSAMTQRLGLQAQRDEYLVAQWGAKGDPHKYFHIILEELVETRGMGSDPYIRMRENMHRGVSWWRPELTSQEDLNDIAAATQKVFEYCVINMAAWSKIRTFSPNLALAGGGALNRQAVALLNGWDSVHVPQNPGDPGSCIGAVLAKTKTKVTLDKQWHR
jgi:carbamoyltransferase